jgi:multidrug efflux pump subunit AcrB
MLLEHILKRGTLLTVIVLIVSVLGLVAALRIPIQMIPDLEVRTIRIDTGWPGATPQDVEKEILIEQERYLQTLPGLRRMVSSAETGRARIELEFPFGVDVNEALIRVNNALSQVTGYPENVDQPRLFTSSFSDNAFMYFSLSPLPGNPLGLDVDMLLDFADDYVRTRLERVPGVSQVDISGAAERQIQIHVSPALLVQRGLTLTDVRDAIRMRNVDRSAGDLDGGKRRYLLRTIGRFDELDDLRDLILSRQGDAVVRLGEVASIQLDHFEVRNLAWFDGERRLNISVRREPGSNVIAIKHAMLPEVDALNRDVLAANGMRLRLVSDDVRYVQDSIGNVWRNLLLGALLAAAVMYTFLRSGTATLAAVIGIPICTVVAFMGLMISGRTINVISLAGVAFAIGMTLDNTIVVLESIEQARRRGLDRLQAAVAGTRAVWSAVIACTVTTVLVFAPVFFVREEAGQLYSDIAIAISAAIIASMLVALIVVPAVMARLGFSGNAASAGGGALQKRLLRALGGLFASPLRRGVCILGWLAIAVVIVLGLTPPGEYLPEGEEPKAFTRMIPPPGYNLAEMSRIAEDVRAWLEAQVEADPAPFDRGETDLPPLRYVSLNLAATGLSVMSEPVRGRDLDAMMQALTERFRAYPGMRAFSSRGSIISSNDGGTRAVALDLSGPDLAALYGAAEAVYRRAGEFFDDPQISSAPASLSLDQPLVEIRPNWERLAELDINAADFGYAVAALSDGAFVDEFFLEDDKVDIFLFGAEGNEQTLDALGRQPLLLPNGRVLPLDALAELRQTVATDSLRRVDGRRTVSLYIVPPRSVALESAVAQVREHMLPALYATGAIPSGVMIDISGASDQLEATRASLTGNFLIALAICYLVLVAIFVHWGYPLLILVTVPLGLAGGILGLAAFNGLTGLLSTLGVVVPNQPLDMITMLGFLILLGVVLNNPILIVERTHRNLQASMALEEAVREAVSSRLRAIVMSTLTTIIGIAPLVLLPGAGTELYRGVGLVVMAGLLCSTLVTLTFLPSLLVALLGWPPLRRRLAGSIRSPQASS